MLATKYVFALCVLLSHLSQIYQQMNPGHGIAGLKKVLYQANRIHEDMDVNKAMYIPVAKEPNIMGADKSAELWYGTGPVVEFPFRRPVFKYHMNAKNLMYSYLNTRLDELITLFENIIKSE